MMGEKLTTAQIKPRHEVKTSLSTTRLPKKTMPCAGLPGFAPPRPWSASRPKYSRSWMLALVFLGLVQSSTGASPMKGDSGALRTFAVCVVTLPCIEVCWVERFWRGKVLKGFERLKVLKGERF